MKNEKVIIIAGTVIILFFSLISTAIYCYGRTTERNKNNSTDISDSLAGLSESGREFEYINDESTELGNQLQYTVDEIQVITEQLRADNERFEQTNKRLQEIITEIESTGGNN